MSTDGGPTQQAKIDQLELVRVGIYPVGAFGVLVWQRKPTGLLTLEPTYPLDQLHPDGPQFVKIPAGRYRCERTVYFRGGYDTYEVTGVLGHSRLLFHAGNVERDTEGCILVGQRIGLVDGVLGLLNSRLGFAELIQLLDGREAFDLLVRGAA